MFTAWAASHGEKPVTVKDLHEEVRQIADPQGRGRQHLASYLEKLAGTRLAGFVLTRQKPVGTWGAATYSLKPTKPREENSKNSGAGETHRGHRDHRGVHPENMSIFNAAADESREEHRASIGVASGEHRGGIGASGEHRVSIGARVSKNTEAKTMGCDTAPPMPPMPPMPLAAADKNGGGHTCPQCNAIPDGTEQPHTTGNETVWLHPECKPFWVEGDGRGRRHCAPDYLGPLGDDPADFLGDIPSFLRRH